MISSSEARKLSHQFLAKYPKRYTHVEYVAKLSEELATHYHADKENALIASYLHDITKYYTINQAKTELQKYYSDEEILEWPIPTWHSLTAEIYARRHLLIDNEDILNAIKFHTTGRPEMSVLEKIIYVSDFAEASRDFENADIRNLAFLSLDKAMLEILIKTKKHLEKTHQTMMHFSKDAIVYYQTRLNGGNE